MAAAQIGAVEPLPLVPGWLGWIWRAWNRLNLDRPYLAGGMGPPIPGRIPWRDIDHWCAAHALDADQREMLDTCFGEMDSEFLKWWTAQNKAA